MWVHYVHRHQAPSSLIQKESKWVVATAQRERWENNEGVVYSYS